ncbi:MAG: MaoC family dehydratase N-terminal domain-containing protein [Roseitalea sp.]|jgi:acyl dehydratase|nr:MaoC family dehydratase N-terminal domain-containing protein [Roseitalea sp.]MBO6745292.1 MaoC family dehydratase N-terminal domain-containing protein [Roseitalea sp.]
MGRPLPLTAGELLPEDFYLSVGDQVEQRQRVTEQAVQTFADLSGDHSPNHVDDEDMAQSVYQRRIAHGALLVAYMSACSTEIVERVPNVRDTATPVSLGYDRIRFIKPVFIGDELTLRYVVREVLPNEKRTISDITISNQDDVTVCVGQHILKWVS